MANQFESLLAQKVGNFEKRNKPKLFDRKDLYDYLDGGAELYLSYDFQNLLVQDYKSGEKLITVELYLMGSSQDAFGLYSLDQEGEALPIGDKANYGSGLLKLWKGNLFVRIIDVAGTDRSKPEILNLGREISGKIVAKGEPPKLLSKLPTEGLVPGSERFFHNQLVLNNLYFLSTENLLNLSQNTSAAMGDYAFGKMNLKLVLISYPDSSSARTAFQNFCKKYLKVSPAENRAIQKVEEGKFVGLELDGKYLWITFESKDENGTKAFLRDLKEKTR